MGVRFAVRSREGRKGPGELDLSFEQERIVLGRGAAADVRLPHATVSELHATVALRGNEWVLRDLGSTNGTKLSGQRLSPSVEKRVREGDVIEVGAYALTFHTGAFASERVTSERTVELARRLLRIAQADGGARIERPRLCVLDGERVGTSIELSDAPSRALIGSAAGAQLVLADPDVLPEHVEVIHDFEGVLVRSLDGRSHIGMSGAAFSVRRLKDGDEITLGRTRLLFEEPAQARLEALKGEPDATWQPPAATVERTEVLPAKAEAQASEHAATRAERPSPRGFDADTIIYLLAALVLLASGLGLFYLLRGQ
jgi:pSer/pThr/pTyr-binding forkhead associated (FHA) protein